MGIAASLFVEVQLTSGIWTDLTTDTNAVDGLRIKYGIGGSGPLDCVASTGECSFVLKNHAGNSGAQQGYYSPLHASKRSGWTFGIPVQVVFSHGSDASVSVSSITLSGTTATVTTGSDHGYATNDYVKITGADQTGYLGTRKITVTGATTFTVTTNSGLTTPATGTITCRKGYVKHRGKVRRIDPDAGQYRRQLVRVTCYDGVRDLAETDLREIALQTNKSETELATAVIDALPTESQPVATEFDAGVDGYPYAFDDLGEGVKALSVLKDIAVSAFALVVMKGDGTLRLISRAQRVTGTSSFTFTNTMHGLIVPAALDQVYNVVRVQIRPRTISASATEEIYSLPSGSSIEIAPGVTREVWTAYTDPNDRQTTIGGSDVVTTLVASTHYTANTVADGSGSDITADIDAAIEPFASTAKWTLTNNNAATAYIRTLKVVGKALRNPGPQVFEATSTQSYGTRPLNLTLRYQANAAIAQEYATYVEDQYNALEDQIEAIEFIANDSSDFLTHALAREPGDIITVTEAVTGLSSTQAVIQSVEFTVDEGPWITCRWGLAPANISSALWILGVEGSSELGETTVLGPF